MLSNTKFQGIRVREGRTYLDVPHLDSEITFIHPAKGPGTYVEIARQLEEYNLLPPTMAHNSSLVHSAWQNPKEKYSNEIINILRNNWLLCFNGILYEPKEGAYIQDNPKIENGEIIMDKSDLIKRLEANDSSVRFVRFGYKIGEQSHSDLERNPFIIGLAGEEGAKKLAETSVNYKLNPYVWSFDFVNGSLVRAASLYEDRDDYRLVVSGGSYVVYRNRRVFGVFPNGRSLREKISLA